MSIENKIDYIDPDNSNTDIIFIAEIIQNIPEIIYVYDTEQEKLVFANKSLNTLLGYSISEFKKILAKHGEGFVYPDDMGFTLNHFKEINTLKPGEKRKFITRVKAKSGDWKWMESVECLLVSYIHKKGKFVLGISKDITEYVNTSMYTVTPGEQKVRNELRCKKCSKLLAVENLIIPSLEIKCLRCGEINTVIGGAHDQMIITDRNGKILYMNEEFEKITGYKFDEVSNKTPAVWGKQMPHEFYEKMWNDILEKKKAIVVRVTNKRKDGKLYPVMLKISPILDEKSEVKFFLGIETVIHQSPEKINRKK